MTQDKQFKAEVRRYAEEHGLAYADARRRVLAERESDSDQGELVDQAVRYEAFIAHAQTLRLTFEEAEAMFELERAWDGRFDGAVKRCNERLELFAANGYLIVLLRDVLTSEELNGQPFSAATPLNDGRWMERSPAERFAAMEREEQRALAKSAIAITKASPLRLEDNMARLMRLMDEAEGRIKP